MSRRIKTMTAALAGIALALTACGSGPTTPDSGLKNVGDAGVAAEDVNRTDPSKLKDGGELKWPLSQMPDNWNYFEVSGTNLDGFRVISTVLPSLFVQKADSSVVANPDYLEDAQLTSSNPQVVTYKINPKAKWSDGRAISWEDFDAQAKALTGKAEGYLPSSTTGYEDIQKVERGANDQEVKVTFARPFAEWKSVFSPLYPKQAMATADVFNKGQQDGPLATAGPFKIGNIDLTGKIVSVVRDDAWWGTKPKLDKITFRVIERPALAEAMANGTIDFYEVRSSIELFSKAKSMQNVVVRQAPAPDYNHLTFNGAPSSILADPKLRVALMRGIDAKTIAKALLGQMVSGDAHIVGNHYFLLGTKGYKDNSAIASYDPEAAKKTLDELGWKMNGEFRAKDGKPLKVRFVIPTPNPTSDQISKIVQNQWKAIGVDIDIQAVPSGDYFQDYVNVGNFDVTPFGWSVGSYPISSSKSIYYLDPKNVKQNYGRVGNEATNKLIDQANSELDDAKRAELANKIDEEVWKNGHQMPLYQLPGAVAVRSNLANIGAVGFATPYDWANIGFTS